MLQTSFGMMMLWLFTTFLVPFIPGVLLLWTVFSDKIKGLPFWILAWFVGNGVLASTLLNMQFFGLGISITSYFLLLLFFCLLLVFKKFFYKTLKKISWKQFLGSLFSTFVIPNQRVSYFQSFQSLSTTFKTLTVLSGLFIFVYLLVSFVRTVQFPTYFDDSFGNWHKPALHIIEDGGILLFGDESEILARGRLGYPLHIPIVKATIALFSGGWNDVYTNLWQRLGSFLFVLFLVSETYKRKENLFLSILPVILIFSMPLVFFHVSAGYLDLPSAIYSVLVIWSFMKFFEEDDYGYVALGLLLGSILSYIKNDGFIIYFPGIVFAFITILCLYKQFGTVVSGLFSKARSWLYTMLGIVAYFYLPFLLVKVIHGLGFNQAQGEVSGVGVSSSVHWEIFSVFDTLFFSENNYGVALIPLVFICFSVFVLPKKERKISLFLFLSALFVFVIFTLVFLFTENYKRVMDQTTVNRVYVMCFAILFSFSGILLDAKKVT